jgi:hypothetical protein
MTSERDKESVTDTFGGPDRGSREDELAGEGPAGPDTLDGPDPTGHEDELGDER